MQAKCKQSELYTSMYRQSSLPSAHRSPGKKTGMQLSQWGYMLLCFSRLSIKASRNRSFPKCIILFSGHTKIFKVYVIKYLLFIKFYMLNWLRFRENHQLLNDVHLVLNIDGFVNSAVIWNVKCATWDAVGIDQSSVLQVAWWQTGLHKNVNNKRKLCWISKTWAI